MFEMAVWMRRYAKEAMRLASNKLPIPTKFVTKETGAAESAVS
jgi:ribosomal protein L16/L10AE